MTFDNLLGDREPKAGTGAELAPRRINPEERFEYPWHALVRYTRPLIIDGDRRGRVTFQTYGDKGPSTMRCRIDYEISDGPRQCQRRRRNRHRLHLHDGHRRLHCGEVLADFAGNLIDPDQLACFPLG